MANSCSDIERIDMLLEVSRLVEDSFLLGYLTKDDYKIAHDMTRAMIAENCIALA